MYLLIYRNNSHLFSFYINSAKKVITIGGSEGDILFPSDMKGYEISLRKEFDFASKQYGWILYPATKGFFCENKEVAEGDVFGSNSTLSVKDFSFFLSYNSNIDYERTQNTEYARGGTIVIDQLEESYDTVAFECEGKLWKTPFSEGKEITVGRKNADIIMAHPEISTMHLQIIMKKEGLFLWNKGKNGVFANGVKIENCVLKHGRYEFLLAGRYKLGISLEHEQSLESFFRGSLTPYFERLEQWVFQKELFNSHPIIFLNGESGVGKEIFAEYTHKISARTGAFITFNAAAIPHELAESELFGTKKGGFTGAEEREGAFLMADKGTLFLDEIGDMPLHLQSKLLRVLEDWKIKRVGEEGSGRKVDIMVIVATNKNLLSEVEKGTFRKDLYYRLSTLQLIIPPLRERKQDIISMAKYLGYTLTGKNIEFTPSAEEKILSYDWPGNVRELKSVMTKFAYTRKTVFEASDFESF